VTWVFQPIPYIFTAIYLVSVYIIRGVEKKYNGCKLPVEGRAQNARHLFFTRDSIPRRLLHVIRVMALALFVSFLASIILAILVIPVASFVPPRCTSLTANLQPIYPTSHDDSDAHTN
jgi:hypothetical protein